MLYNHKTDVDIQLLLITIDKLYPHFIQIRGIYVCVKSCPCLLTVT
jgi:hypothetical protein